jgi:VIT1/CCC1 family predicted Fe2+/Mn2+ transporter
LAFFLAGSIPLLPFVFFPDANVFLLSCLATAITLFVVGSLRTRVTGARWFVSGLEMLLIGSMAAAAAYGVGHLLQQLV